MISFYAVQDRIGSMRPDKLEREWNLAFQIASRRLAVDTLALQETVDFTISADASSADVYDAETDEKECLHIFKASYQNSNGVWIPLVLINQENLFFASEKIVEDSGTMEAYSCRMGKFTPNCPPEVETTVRAIVAYKPLGDFIEVGFPHNFEDAIVEGAIAHLLRLPGAEKNLQESEMAERKYQSMASGLRGITLIGNDGYRRGSARPERYW